MLLPGRMLHPGGVKLGKEHVCLAFRPDQQEGHILQIFCSVRGLKLERCGCDLGPVRLGVTARDVEATCCSRGSGESFLGARNVRRNSRCLPGLGLAGDLVDEGFVSVENVSLAELLDQVGAGKSRDAGGLVLIESNPHPSVLRKCSQLDRPFDKGPKLPIPMPHKLNRPLPLPVSRRELLPDAFPANRVRKQFTPATKQTTLLYPRLLSKILMVSNDEVRMVLESWKGKHRSKSGAIANVILELGRRDYVGKALQLFAWVREQARLWPDDIILLAITQVALESGKLTLANKILALYGPLSTKSALVGASIYADQGHIRDALRVLSRIEETVMPGISELYAKMIVKAGESGAKAMVQELAASRHFKPQLQDCSRVMATCSKLGLDEEVEALFQQYIDQGGKPNIVMYTTLMQARARAGKVRQALSLFWELEEAGIKPDLIACRVMIRLFEKVGDFKKAVNLYNHMRITGFVPTSDVYNCMIRLYCREGRLAKAREVIQEMDLWGCTPTSETVEHLSAAGYEPSRQAHM